MQYFNNSTTTRALRLSWGAHRALCTRCAKSRLFPTTGSHGSEGPEFCTPDAVLSGSCMLLQGGGFSGGVPGINNVIIGAVPALCKNTPMNNWAHALNAMRC